MKMRPTYLISALSIAWGVVVWADETDVVTARIAEFEAGVLCAQNSDVVGEAPGTVAGTTHIIDETPPFVSKGRLVPAVLGIGFGVTASVASDEVLRDVVMRVTHPPFAGSGATRQSFVTTIRAQGDPSITFYQFDHTYELAVGDWTMTAEHNGETLYKATFTVVPPDMLPELAGVCGYIDLLG